MKKILGLDIGTNSIGWAFIENDIEEHTGKIIGLGSRIIPMEGREKDFEAGTSVTKNAERRQARSTRRLIHRYKIRRSRLIKIFKALKWFPENFPEDFKNLEKFNINKFIPFEKNTIKEAEEIFGTEDISTDWIVYFLRTKALKEKISLSELARVIYHFNQRRGFKSSRKENKGIENINEEVKYPIREKKIEIVRINSIVELNEKNKYGKVFLLSAANADKNEIKGNIIRKTRPEWENKEIELEVTKIISKAGDIKIEFRLPDRSDWEKLKIALEKDIKESGLFAGEYHFNHLLQDRNYRIKDRIIDRSFYQDEFDAIWEKQSEYYPELKSRDILPALVDILYKHNNEKRNELLANDLKYLIKNDIIYYQRGLKSQKYLISECRYEKKKDENGNLHGIKAAPKSSPVFQEFRIWQDIHNLRIIKNEEKQKDGKIRFNVDKTGLFLDNCGKEKLYSLFNRKAEITTKDILRELSTEEEKLKPEIYRINYPIEKVFKGNETKNIFRRVFKKHNYETEGEQLLNNENRFYLLWHIVYSINEEEHITEALIRNFKFDRELAKHISKLPEFPKQYAAYSSKAIKKLLTLMRCGSLWNADIICDEAKDRICKIINGNVDQNIPLIVRDRLINGNYKQFSDFSGLELYMACYLVYGRHSEREKEDKFESPDEIKLLEQNTLRNPIVEQITNETLQVVKEIWKQFGRPDEIHIELARDLKKNSEERRKITEQVNKNENDRKRVVSILRELFNANPDSPADIERLRLWEETGNKEAKDSFPKISKEPTKAEIEKYLLWGEQNHISPYTGKIIPLSKLFTLEYEIEHIIPRSRFFDDSFANKTICEASVNSFKDNSTALEMIYEHGGRQVEHHGMRFGLLDTDEYKEHIYRTFYGKKRRYFLSEEIPEGFIERQINDTRYIGKKLGELLYPIASDEIIFTIGSITSELKDKWGFNRVWKEVLKPRFERLEKLTGEKLIELDKEHNDIRFKKDFKRIDHRHHALDALIIAATGREHIRYINSLNAADEREKINVKYRLVKSRIREFVLPWDTFTKDAKEILNGVIVSHKNRSRLLTKGINYYTKWVQEDGRWVKKSVKQDKGHLLSVRKSMFKEPLGIIHLAEYKNISLKQAVEVQFNYLTKYKDRYQSRIADKGLRNQINILIKNCSFDLAETLKYLKNNPINSNDDQVPGKVQVLEFKEYAAKRVSLDKSFDLKKIDKIPYSYQNNNRLVKILREHLKENNNNPGEAFSGEGLDLLSKKYGKPITKITTYEEIGNKVQLNNKLVEADKGSNAFFVIYENLNEPSDRIITERSTISLLEAIDCLANGLPVAEDRPGYKKIVLSPNDLVYVPEPDENIKSIDWNNKKKISERIYKVVSFTKRQIFFVPHYVSSPLMDTIELGSNNKSESSWDIQMIKKVCIKVKIDRLGNIIPEG